MINRTSSTLDQNKGRKSNLNKIKPLYFFIGFVGLSMLVAFIIGGYFLGKNIEKDKDQNASTSLYEQVELNPVSLPGNPDNWIVYKFEPLNLQFKLPEELNKKSEWRIEEINGSNGKRICFNDEKNQNSNRCEGETLVIIATSNNFTSDTTSSFLDSQGFNLENGTYTIKALSGEKYELTDVRYKSYENNENFEIIKIVGKNGGFAGVGSATPGTPGEGYLGAIVNTNNPEFPAIVLRMKISSDISEYEFDQILESIKKIE